MVLQLNSRVVQRITRGASLAAALALAPLCAACSDGACFEWTEAEGACPAQAEALTFFEEPSCHFSEIKTVDSEGTFDDGACCYDVTKWDPNEERSFICQ